MKVKDWAKKLFSSSSDSDSSSTKTCRSLTSVRTDLSLPPFSSNQDYSFPSPTLRLYSASTTSSVSSISQPKKKRVPKFFRNNHGNGLTFDQSQDRDQSLISGPLPHNTVNANMNANMNGHTSGSKSIDSTSISRVQPETTTIYYQDGLIREQVKQIQAAMGQLTEITTMRTESLPLRNYHKETSVSRDHSAVSLQPQHRAIVSPSPKLKVDTRRRSKSFHLGDASVYSMPLKAQTYNNILKSDNCYQLQQHHCRQRAPSRPEIFRGASYERVDRDGNNFKTLDPSAQSTTKYNKINAYQPAKSPDFYPKCAPSPIMDLKPLGPPPTSRPPLSPVQAGQMSWKPSLDTHPWSGNTQTTQTIQTKNESEALASAVGIFKEAVEDLNRKFDQILSNSTDALTSARLPQNKNQYSTTPRFNEAPGYIHPPYCISDSKMSYPLPNSTDAIGDAKLLGQVHKRPPIWGSHELQITPIYRNGNQDIRSRTPPPPLPITCRKPQSAIPLTEENESLSRTPSPLISSRQPYDYFSEQPGMLSQIEYNPYNVQSTKANTILFNNAIFMNHNNGSSPSLYPQSDTLYQRDDYQSSPSPTYSDKNAFLKATPYHIKPNNNAPIPPSHPPPPPPRSTKSNESLCGVFKQVYLNKDLTVPQTDSHKRRCRV